MKKNLLSVLILALLLVNLVLTSIMMINVVSTNSKTAEMVNSILVAMNLELYEPGQTGPQVSLDDTDTYDMEEMMIPLAASTIVNEDGSVTVDTKQSYIMFTLSLLQDKTNKDYKKMGGEENIAAQASLIKDAVNQVAGNHTLEDFQTDFDGIREEILKEIQKLFGSDFIYKIAISGVKYG